MSDQGGISNPTVGEFTPMDGEVGPGGVEVTPAPPGYGSGQSIEQGLGIGTNDGVAEQTVAPPVDPAIKNFMDAASGKTPAPEQGSEQHPGAANEALAQLVEQTRP